MQLFSSFHLEWRVTWNVGWNFQKLKKTYDGMKDLFLRGPFTWCCNKEHFLFLKERIPPFFGCVGDKVITVLRDTGCSGAVIRKELILDAQMTGQIQRCFFSRRQSCGRRSGRNTCIYTILHNNRCSMVFLFAVL